MKVLLLSAYAARSHVQWQNSVQQMFGTWQWQVLSLPPRHFSWRVRGNPLYWSQTHRDVLEQDWDLLVATSMVDLATLRGLVPSLARLPTVLYFHENQFAYPQHQQRHSLLEAQMVSLYSCLAADSVIFNSAYNRDSFLAGCGALLDKLPDRVPPGIVDKLRASSGVLPVPLQLDQCATAIPSWPGMPGELACRPLRIVWSGRFEHDKGGDGLLLLLEQLESTDLDYELAVTGQQFRASPQAFDSIRRRFAHRLVHFGYLESPADYYSLLRAADLVLSTALHEFQGLAVLEGVASGCLPVVPERLVYPEIYPASHCYASCPDEPIREAQAAAQLIQRLAQELLAGACEVPDVSAFDSGHLEPRYRELFTGLVA